MAVETAPAPAAHDEWRDRRWRATVLVFVGLWLATGVALALTGEKRSDLNQLSASISQGSVTRVEIVGAPRDSWRGRTTVTLQWRGRWLDRFAEVQVTGGRMSGTFNDTGRITGDPAKYLRAIAFPQDLDVSYSDPPHRQEWLGWRSPAWVAWLGVATWFGTVLLSGNGPEPWRATRWAWTWLTLWGGPLGCLAFLLLGGPLGTGRPRTPSRRLTGGWAFLIGAFLLGGSSGA